MPVNPEVPLGVGTTNEELAEHLVRLSDTRGPLGGALALAVARLLVRSGGSGRHVRPIPGPIPLYRCHKEVQALKIIRVSRASDGAILHFDGWNSVAVGKSWAGSKMTAYFDGRDAPDCGYYIVYKDGYTSWSPTAAFEEGYTQIPVYLDASKSTGGGSAGG